MGEQLLGLKRTMMCGEARETHVGQNVTFMGWVQRKRNLGFLVFLDLRDRTGIVQVVFGEEINKEAFEKADNVKSEYCVAVTGKLVLRESPNTSLPTGLVELKAEEIKILSESETPPIYIKENLDAAENIRLKYRYLDLRRPDMQRNLILRHKTTKIVRDFLDEQGFLEMETPMLTKSTPEGARDYLVPSRNYKGRFYALPQSPQIFKQLLMVSGYDRYFQIVKCFRDEDLRANRQPEFTQIDLEMSFVEENDVISVNEQLIKKIFKEIVNYDVQLPIERMPYSEAMDRFGSDKPDLRFGMEIQNLSEVVVGSEFVPFKNALEDHGSVRCIVAPNSATMGRKQIDKLVDFVKTYRAKGLAWIAVKEDEVKSSVDKFFSKEELQKIIDKAHAKIGDLILIVADKDEVVLQSLGALRLEMAKKLEILKDNKEFRFVWITDFPLFEYDEEENRYVAKHHPFTSAKDEDLQYLESDPSRVRAKAYDIVLNGEEIGGGSIRIHDSEIQERMFKALGFTKESAWERFGFLLEAFKFGPPPHGGMAYGLDRLIMFLANTDNIKDVIAFPKNQNAFCPMSEAPNVVDDKQLKELGIARENIEE